MSPLRMKPVLQLCVAMVLIGLLSVDPPLYEMAPLGSESRSEHVISEWEYAHDKQQYKSIYLR